MKMMSNLKNSEVGLDDSPRKSISIKSDMDRSVSSCGRVKCNSITSPFYDNLDDKKLESDVFTVSMDPSKQQTKQSQRLPHWAWFLLSKSLGIPLYPDDRPIIGTTLHILTFGSALSYVLTGSWYVIYDIISPNTRQDILKGMVTIVLTVMWASIGLYAKSLNRRLFHHPRFLSDVRMHSRTIFKINAALLVFLLGLIFVSINDLEAATLLNDETCLKIELSTVVCKINFVSRVVFSVFALVWNTLVAIVLISVCRTHTIGIRRFIRELEHDALKYDHKHCERFQDAPMTREDICEETFWLEEDDHESQPYLVIHHRNSPVAPMNEDLEQTLSPSAMSYCNYVGENLENAENEIGILFSPIAKNNTEDKRTCISLTEHTLPLPVANQFNILRGREDSYIAETMDNISIAEHVMTSEEILHKHWKISCRLRMSSCALQRWIASIIALVIIWCFVFLIRWQDHAPGVVDIIQFVVPLLLLPLLCSAFAEVNMEGVRMIKCVCPIEERLPVIRYLGLNPLQMTIFGYGMSYGAIMTVVFAIFAAFTSRLIFAEIQQSTS